MAQKHGIEEHHREEPHHDPHPDAGHGVVDVRDLARSGCGRGPLGGRGAGLLPGRGGRAASLRAAGSSRGRLRGPASVAPGRLLFRSSSAGCGRSGSRHRLLRFEGLIRRLALIAVRGLLVRRHGLRGVRSWLAHAGVVLLVVAPGDVGGIGR